MPTQHEIHAPAPAAANVTSQKLLQLLRKRLRQLLRVTIGLAIGLALGTTALAIWWLTSLNGLPDVGDPFDVAAFRALRIPDDQNAFAYLRRAVQKLTPYPVLPRAVNMLTPTVAWSKADPKLRAWVDANCQALELFQRGAEQPDAIRNLAKDGLNLYDSVNAYEVTVLSLLEGAKRQESGDMEGAWNCYRAVLRMTTHSIRRSSEPQFHNIQYRRWLRQRLTTWAADPRTTISQIKPVLDEALQSEPRPEWDSFALKMGYLEFMRSLERPIHPLDRQEIERELTVRLGDMQMSADIIESIESARRFLLREPERSRRVAKLLYANWLAHVESREPRPRKPAVRALLKAIKPRSVALYPVSARSLAGARALPPHEVARWLVTTRDAKLQILWANRAGTSWPPIHPHQQSYRALVIMLATEIYHRERGILPPSEADLVKTYLKTLPDDGSADLADDTTPTVE